jgi:hypothetical protein
MERSALHRKLKSLGVVTSNKAGRAGGAGGGIAPPRAAADARLD